MLEKCALEIITFVSYALQVYVLSVFMCVCLFLYFL